MASVDWEALWGVLPVLAWILFAVLRNMRRSGEMERTSTGEKKSGGLWRRPVPPEGEKAYEPVEPSARGSRIKVPPNPTPPDEPKPAEASPDPISTLLMPDDLDALEEEDDPYGTPSDERPPTI